MNDKLQRLKLMELILNEILSYMRLSIRVNKNYSTDLEYTNRGVTVTKRVNFEDVAEFCGIKNLAFRYFLMGQETFFDKLTDCKFFNYEMFPTSVKSKLWKIAGKENIKNIVTDFIRYLNINKEGLSYISYKFSSHHNLYKIAIDNFFDMGINKKVQTNKLKNDSMYGTGISYDKIRETFKKIGNYTNVSDNDIQGIREIIEDIVRRGGERLNDYILKNNEKTIQNDLDAIVAIYINNNFPF